jgi:16S rRNA (guanine1516-N2)-methyltransferase
MQKTHYPYSLSRTEEGLVLQSEDQILHPFKIDFSDKTLCYRVKHATLKNEKLARALGVHPSENRTILDATRGLGQDSFILASLGFKMTLLERSPIIYALLQDALERASHPFLKNITLKQEDAIHFLPSLPSPPVIYLDPMFPPRKKSALTKKSMRLFHEIVGADNDADQLLNVALSCATLRVVVKRPRLAPPLAGLSPDFSTTGNRCRFDVYLIKAGDAGRRLQRANREHVRGRTRVMT